MIQYLLINTPPGAAPQYELVANRLQAIEQAQSYLQPGDSDPEPDLRYPIDSHDGVIFVGTISFPLQVVVVRRIETPEDTQPTEPTMTLTQALTLFRAMLGDSELGIDCNGETAVGFNSPEVNSAIRVACADVPFAHHWTPAQSGNAGAKRMITGFITYMRGWLNALELGMEKP